MKKVRPLFLSHQTAIRGTAPSLYSYHYNQTWFVTQNCTEARCRCIHQDLSSRLLHAHQRPCWSPELSLSRSRSSWPAQACMSSSWSDLSTASGESQCYSADDDTEDAKDKLEVQYWHSILNLTGQVSTGRQGGHRYTNWSEKNVCSYEARCSFELNEPSNI